jgi:hypothetical protein
MPDGIFTVGPDQVRAVAANQMVRDAVLANLRKQVEACIQDALEHYEASDHADWVTAAHAGRTSAFTDVLDLIDGSVG